MHLSFLTGLYYAAFCLLGLVSGYYLGFNLFLLICDLFGVTSPPYWLNVAFAAGFGFVLAVIYLVIAVFLHWIKNVTYKVIDVMADFLTRLVGLLYNKD